MNESPAQIASRFCEQLLAGRQADRLSDLEQYFAAGGSVCALARKGVVGLVNEYGLEHDDAEALALRLNGLATWVLRRFIESQLTSPEPPPAHMRQGLLSLIADGPTYGKLFQPDFAKKCPVDAIEAIHSPVAYAVWLKHWSEQRLRPSDPDQAYALRTRRVDLNTLRIDPVAVHGVVSSVEVVSAVLEKSIEDSLGEIENLDRLLSEWRYPNGLPYHHPWTTLDELTRDLGQSVGAVVELCDPDSPYFLHALPWSETADHALTQASRLSPSQRLIMTEDAHFPETDEDAEDAYFQDNFGLKKGSVEKYNLNQTVFFNQRTKLTQLGLEALLSVELFAPSVSEHVLVTDVAITPGHAGSVFVNNGVAEASMGIEYRGSELTNRITQLFLDNDVYRFDKIDRLNRKIRLDNGLQLPSHETDALLSAIIGAESARAELAEGALDENAPNYWMTDNTLRALGLFQMLRENYQCSAEEFAAFVGDLSIFGRGAERSQFDRVFNQDTLSTPPLVLDDSEFALVPVSEGEALTVVQICGGLHIDLATYFTLAPLIADAHGLTKLKRSLPVISSFYRMARLPQILGVAPNLAVTILDLLSADTWRGVLAGQPHINPERMSTPDVLSEIRRLEGWARWCADSGLSVAWTVEHVKPIAAPPQPSETQIQLLAQIRGQLAPALFTEAALSMAGVSALSNNRQWTNQLLELADHDGLVIHRDESAEQPYEPYAREVVELVVRRVLDREEPETVEKILGVLLGSRASQHSVVQESLAVFGQLSSALVLPVLSWSGGTVHDVLVQVLGRTTATNVSGRGPRDEPPGDPFLGMLEGFTRRSEVVKELRLSAEFLALYLSIGDGVNGLPAAQPFTPSALYYLTVYNRAVVLSQAPEAQLLAYLRLVNGLPGDLSGGGLRLVQEQAARLLAELFDCSAEEVRACANHVNAGPGYIRTLAHLDLFTRLRGFSLSSKLDAKTTLKIGLLDEQSSFSQYEEVAHQVAALLTDPNRASPLLGIQSTADQVAVECSVDVDELVANSNDTALLTVTVTRAQAPQGNVNIYWASKLCTFDRPVSTTDGEGVATVTVRAGTTMGRDVISYRLDAREPQPAVTLTLGNDPTTFAFYRLDAEIYVRKAKVDSDVTLRVVLLDRYGNPALYEPVTWILGAPFVDIATSTNASGVTEATFTSDVGLEITPIVKVTSSSSQLTFPSIEFIE
ncbi:MULTISPECIES: Tc toxin subunit A [unclassified Pseudomonas]|uniref:Tc toxin subunit A n=1 Tax=unclassified Pseudomonas TaxID=196821 RepID=UPI00119A85B7|nr:MULTISPECIES: Tc toxin subunit A [unclassified Pseudomonas]TWC20447.1 virulence plasmid A protein [Pseudomonas sp. SJZ075]TWC25674.1 virulence plasmid A protein [Pseudomonas sp. SJZ074]TWC35877.1 virulence plasmid A protein [Pseudomonas sp. SJZ078]TWC42485.1 virulence plasmid A protein [Pseudomonas sp. SJZ085]TWC56745.1 virulence plasmid A protein [Pseudomonas sp. SJZ124]